MSLLPCHLDFRLNFERKTCHRLILCTVEMPNQIQGMHPQVRLSPNLYFTAPLDGNA